MSFLIGHFPLKDQVLQSFQCAVRNCVLGRHFLQVRLPEWKLFR